MVIIDLGQRGRRADERRSLGVARGTAARVQVQQDVGPGDVTWQVSARANENCTKKYQNAIARELDIRMKYFFEKNLNRSLDLAHNFLSDVRHESWDQQVQIIPGGAGGGSSVTPSASSAAAATSSTAASVGGSEITAGISTTVASGVT